MFSFFHRTPKINLDCFIDNNYVYENVPVVNAHKTYPDWWLNIPNGHKRVFDFNNKIDNETTKDIFASVQRNNNMKNCYGFLEFYKRGVVFESWSDYRFKTGLVGYKFYVSNGKKVEEHGQEQRGEGFSRYLHAKLSNPWILECKEDEIGRAHV